MTITEEELRRFDALLCNGPLSRERGRELVAEVRSLRRGNADLGGVQAQLQNERDALRAENERLQQEWADIGQWHHEAVAEAAELRASLADAVGRMEHALDDLHIVEPLVTAARAYAAAPHGGTAGDLLLAAKRLCGEAPAVDAAGVVEQGDGATDGE